MPRRAYPGRTRPQPRLPSQPSPTSPSELSSQLATRKSNTHRGASHWNASAYATRPRHIAHRPAPFRVARCLFDSGRHPCALHKASCTPWTRRLGFGSGVGFWLLEGRYSGLRWLRGEAVAAVGTRETNIRDTNIRAKAARKAWAGGSLAATTDSPAAGGDGKCTFCTSSANLIAA